MKKKLKEYGLGIDNLKTNDMLAVANVLPTIASAIDVIQKASTKNSYPTPTLSNLQTFGLGGIVQNNVPINVEDGETFETPQGKVGTFQGAEHEEGGIDTSLPEHSTIYSDRLVGEDGNTFAERHTNRIKKETKLSKLLDKRPVDGFLKNTVSRTKETNEKQDTKDKNVMSLVNMLEESADKVEEFMFGGDVKSYANGTDDLEFFGKDDELYRKIGNVYQKRVLNNDKFEWVDFKPDVNFIQDNMTMSNNAVPTGALGLLQGYTGEQNSTTFDVNKSLKRNVPFNPSVSKSLSDIMGTDATNKNVNAQDLMDESLRLKGNYNTQDDNNLYQDEQVETSYTEGDNLGIGGSLISGISPLLTTLANRAGDAPNINRMKGVANRALSKYKDLSAMLDSSLDSQNKEVSRNVSTLMGSNRNNVTGLNSLIALDAATSSNITDASNKAYEQYLNASTNLGMNESNTLLNADMQTAQQQQAVDDMDKQDRDMFYTNLNQDVRTLGTATQSVAKFKNEKESANDELDIINGLSKYNLKFKKINGKYKLVQ